MRNLKTKIKSDPNEQKVIKKEDIIHNYLESKNVIPNREFAEIIDKEFRQSLNGGSSNNEDEDEQYIEINNDNLVMGYTNSPFPNRNTFINVPSITINSKGNKT